MTVTKVCLGAEFQSATNTILNTVGGSILNDGGGLLTNVTVTDNPAFDAGTFGFFTCNNGLPTTTPKSPATLAAGASICY